MTINSFKLKLLPAPSSIPLDSPVSLPLQRSNEPLLPLRAVKEFVAEKQNFAETLCLTAPQFAVCPLPCVSVRLLMKHGQSRNSRHSPKRGIYAVTGHA